MTFVGFIFALIVVALVCVACMAAKSQANARRVQKQRDAFWQRICLLTPWNKPLFVYQSLGLVWAITTFDRFTGQGAERIKIKTSGGEKLLVNKTCSIPSSQSYESVSFLLERIMGRAKPSLDCYGHAVDQNDRDLWELAAQRLFLEVGDLYVQTGTKVPPGTTRAEVERLNTRCYTPVEVWEALEADITQSIQSRTRVV
jgi:hypothetical protein